MYNTVFLLQALKVTKECGYETGLLEWAKTKCTLLSDGSIAMYGKLDENSGYGIYVYGMDGNWIQSWDPPECKHGLDRGHHLLEVNLGKIMSFS